MLFLGSALAAPVAKSDVYELDGAHTTIGFGVRHLVVSTVHGKFNAFTGSIELDNDGAPVKASAVIEATSIDTDNQKRDDHLRGADFFDVAKFPQVTFESTKIAKAGDAFNVTGNLTMHGVTKEITIPMTLSGPVTDPWGNVKIGLEGSAKVDRKDYGLVWNKTLDGGGVVVGDDVTLTISIEAGKAN
jgi:polyisoprenoid-binding protein YceI